MPASRTAYLGPPGSYTELALREHLTSDTAVPCFSVAEVFRAIEEGDAEAGFVPLENMLQGPVAETLDLLYQYKNRVFIEKTFLYEIYHCIGILPASGSLEERKNCIKRICSHQQSLGQCSQYIRRHFPRCELCPSTSNSAAAAQVKTADLADSAVIAGRGVLEEYGFEILAEDIADVPGNQTRFALILPGDFLKTRGSQHSSLGEGNGSAEYATSIVVDPCRDRQGLLFEMLEVISQKHRVNLLSIHSRPDARGGFVFHLDLEGSFYSAEIQNCIQSLHQYCLSSTGNMAEVIVCGSYERKRFHSLPFQTIGIIGGKGRMGTWFRRFFQDIGLEVLISDLEDGLSYSALAERSDVVMLSVPMSDAARVVQELKPFLRPGQLVVENCSIKSCILPALLDLGIPRLEILGIHTMFGAETKSLRGENIVITRTEKSAEKALALEDLFYKYGAKLTQATASEHDARAAFVQALVHFASLCVADVIPESFPSPKDIEPYSTPNSRAILEVGSRVLRQNKELLADLQLLNLEYPRVRHKFVETVSRLSQALDKGDIETYLQTIEEAKKFLNSSSC